MSQGERDRSATEPSHAKRKRGTAERRIAQTSPVSRPSPRSPGKRPLATDDGRKTISSASRTRARPPASFPPQTIGAAQGVREVERQPPLRELAAHDGGADEKAPSEAEGAGEDEGGDPAGQVGLIARHAGQERDEERDDGGDPGRQ